MVININLSTQEEGKYRMLYLVLGVWGLVFIGIVIFYPNLRQAYLVWLPLIPSAVQSLLYGLGKKGMFAAHASYLRVNEERIEISKGGLFSRAITHYWKDTKSVDIKLFAIELTHFDGQVTSVNLENLTDDNLKVVKDNVLMIKKRLKASFAHLDKADKIASFCNSYSKQANGGSRFFY